MNHGFDSNIGGNHTGQPSGGHFAGSGARTAVLTTRGFGDTLLIMRATGTIGAENAAFSASDAVADTIIAVVEVAAANYVDLINSQIAVKANLGIVVNATAAKSLPRGKGMEATKLLYENLDSKGILPVPEISSVD